MIGNTPLIYLKSASEETGCKIYGKAEFLNPGGSIKDRTALGIIMDAEEKKQLEPNGLNQNGLIQCVEDRIFREVLGSKQANRHNNIQIF